MSCEKIKKKIPRFFVQFISDKTYVETEESFSRQRRGKLCVVKDRYRSSIKLPEEFGGHIIDAWESEGEHITFGWLLVSISPTEFRIYYNDFLIRELGGRKQSREPLDINERKKFDDVIAWISSEIGNKPDRTETTRTDEGQLEYLSWSIAG